MEKSPSIVDYRPPYFPVLAAILKRREVRDAPGSFRRFIEQQQRCQQSRGVSDARDVKAGVWVWRVPWRPSPHQHMVPTSFYVHSVGAPGGPFWLLLHLPSPCLRRHRFTPQKPTTTTRARRFSFSSFLCPSPLSVRRITRQLNACRRTAEEVTCWFR